MSRQILEYLEAYADHFGFRGCITFRTEVTRVEPLPDSSFRVFTEVGGLPKELSAPFASLSIWS